MVQLVCTHPKRVMVVLLFVVHHHSAFRKYSCKIQTYRTFGHYPSRRGFVIFQRAGYESSLSACLRSSACCLGYRPATELAIFPDYWTRALQEGFALPSEGWADRCVQIEFPSPLLVHCSKPEYCPVTAARPLCMPCSVVCAQQHRAVLHRIECTSVL